MSAALAKFIRPAAVAAAILLVAGTAHTTPASADDSDAIFVIDARAVYPYEEAPGYPGYGEAVPADAGPGPGSVSLSVVLFNRTDDALHDISIKPRVVTNGQVDSIRCATAPLFPDDVPLLDGVLQGELPPFPTPPPPPPGPRPPTWTTDPGVKLAPHTSLYCDVEVSGITDRVLSETVTSATALRVDASTPATYAAHTWAAAGQLRQGFPTPRSEPVAIFGSAFVDSNENGVRDEYPDEPEKTEPALKGLRVTLTGPDGKPVPDFLTGRGLIGPQVTGQDGSFTFSDPRPIATYTVTLDLDSPGLAGLGKARDAFGTWNSGRRTWTQTVRTLGNGVALWRFVPGNRVYLTMEAPRSAVAGTPVTITGRAERADSGAAGGPVILESAPPANPPTDWKKFADVTNHDGRLSVSLIATRTADLRFRYLGDDHTSGSVQWPHRRFSVFTAPVALRITAPATVRPGEPLTISGAITRSGKAFQSRRIVLQYAPDDDRNIWTRVAEVRSTAGYMTATVQAPRTGYYRWRYLGDSKTSVGHSSQPRVVVSP